MTALTSRQRLLRLFQGKDIDKTPVWLLFPYFPSRYYADVFHQPLYQDFLPMLWRETDTIERYVGFDTGFCYNCHPEILRRKSTERDGTNVLEKQEIVCGDVVLSSGVLRGEKTESISFLKEIDDLDKVLAMPYQMPRPDLEDYRAHERLLGENGLMGVNVLDTLTVFHDLCTETDFCLYAFSEEERVTAFLDVIFERVMAYLTYLLENKIGEVFWISGAEFAVPPMLGPDLFSRLVVRYTKPMCDLIRSYGKFSMLHCHGKIGMVLDSLRTIGFDAIHPLEAPPMGDCPLQKAREALGRECILTGNLQYGDILTQSPDEVEMMARTAVREGSGGRFILSVTGGPSAPAVDTHVIENYKRIIRVAAQ